LIIFAFNQPCLGVAFGKIISSMLSICTAGAIRGKKPSDSLANGGALAMIAKEISNLAMERKESLSWAA
jgi:hypothetical protein